MNRILLLVLILPTLTLADVKITTWNIEHLGSGGRGFGGGFGAGDIPMRTDAQLEAIADFIKSDLGSDVLAVQEIAITGPDHTSLERIGRTNTILPESHRYGTAIKVSI